MTSLTEGKEGCVLGQGTLASYFSLKKFFSQVNVNKHGYTMTAISQKISVDGKILKILVTVEINSYYLTHNF